MAIAFDTSVAQTGGAVSSLSWSHTCSGLNRILFVYVSENSTVGITSVTYNSVAMTSIGNVNGSRRMALYYLVAPASGANTVAVTFASASSNIRCASVSYTGAKQTGQPDSSNSTNVSNGTISTTVVTGGCWTIASFYDDALATLTAGQTQRQAPDTYTLIEDSNAVVSTGSQALSTSGGTPGNVLAIIASFSPAASPTQGGAFLLNMI